MGLLISWCLKRANAKLLTLQASRNLPDVHHFVLRTISIKVFFYTIQNEKFWPLRGSLLVCEIRVLASFVFFVLCSVYIWTGWTECVEYSIEKWNWKFFCMKYSACSIGFVLFKCGGGIRVTLQILLLPCYRPLLVHVNRSRFIITP